MPEVPEHVLLAAAQQGDRQAWGELLARRRSLGFAIALRMLHDPHKAEDAAQDAYLAAYEGQGSYNPTRSSINTWFGAIVRNKCLDARRAARTRMGSAVSMEFHDPPAEELDPATRAEIADDLKRVRQEIEALPDKERDALRFVASECLNGPGKPSAEDVARAIGGSPGTNRTRLSRAIAKVSSAITEAGSKRGVQP